jgi:hypothetical protein
MTLPLTDTPQRGVPTYSVYSVKRLDQRFLVVVVVVATSREWQSRTRRLVGAHETEFLLTHTDFVSLCREREA